MCKHILLLPALFLFFQQATGQKTNTDNRFKELDRLVNRILSDWRVSGCAVAVVEKDKVVYEKGFGYRDYENKIPVTPNTVFSIASCTKAFTGQLIGTLVNDGKLDINEPVHNYYPELAFYNDFLTDNITVKDMLTHRTGLPRHDWLTHSKNSVLTTFFRFQRTIKILQFDVHCIGRINTQAYRKIMGSLHERKNFGPAEDDQYQLFDF